MQGAGQAEHVVPVVLYQPPVEEGTVANNGVEVAAKHSG
jgi:hypothetical protein